MDVAERRRDGKLAVLDFGESFVDLPDLLGLRVELGGINIRIVDAVLFPTRYAKLHLK